MAAGDDPTLAEQLRARTEQLELAQAQLVQQEKMSSLGRLVAGIAHELNNPINFIYGNVDFLGDYLARLLTLVDALDGPDLSPEARARLERARQAAGLEQIRADWPSLVQAIRAGAERTAGIVADLRAYARATRAELREVDLAAQVQTTLHLISPLIRDRLEVRVLAPPDLPKVVCNPGHVGQVLMNLLTNAAQAIVGPGWIEVALAAVDDHVTLTVADSGPGIPPEALERLGEPFFTTKGVGEGTGLGLWIIDGVVRAHGGTLRWSNRPGAGAEFTVVLPRRAPETARGALVR